MVFVHNYEKDTGETTPPKDMIIVVLLLQMIVVMITHILIPFWYLDHVNILDHFGT